MKIEEVDLKAVIEEETGQIFNKNGFIKCPFHNEKTPSFGIKYYGDPGKYKFKCFGCGIHGDVLDFIKYYRGYNTLEAKRYLGIDIEEDDTYKSETDKIRNYIGWQLENKLKGWTFLEEFYRFPDENNNTLYYKCKFIDTNGKKQIRYYHFENNKVKSIRGCDEIPYNLYNVLKGLEENKTIIIVEGEKDADNLNRLLGNKYVVTSVKSCKDFEIIISDTGSYYLCGDTGKAGEEYINYILNQLKGKVKELKVIRPTGLKELGDNKDVTDWINSGHTKKEFLKICERSLNLENKKELQQDRNGIYSVKADGGKRYITNFRLIEAKRIKYINDDLEGVKLVFKSNIDCTIEKMGAATIFDDVRSFRNFLGTIDLSFRGNINDLIRLKEWINKYFALEVDEVYKGVQVIEKDDRLILVTGSGSMTSNENISTIKTDSKSDISILEENDITTEELKELINHILNFASKEKTIPIIGTTVNNMMAYHNEICNFNLHHLLIVGESGSGKSKTLENIIAMILNYPLKDIRALGQITPFALTKTLTEGNYTALFEEFKPSYWDKYKIANISECFRNLYSRSTISRGGKSLIVREFQYRRPIILVGEESYPHQEQAQIERSCIVYLSINERTKDNTESYKWLEKRPDVIRRFGKSLIKLALDMSVDEYKERYYQLEDQYSDQFKDRILTTAVNISMGIELINDLLFARGLQPITGYKKYVIKNIKDEILEGTNSTRSIVEQMLLQYDSLILSEKCGASRDIILSENGTVYISTSDMLDCIFRYVKEYDSADIKPIKIKDFRKQAKKSGYIVSNETVIKKIGGKRKRVDEYDRNKLISLGLNSFFVEDYPRPSFKVIETYENDQMPF